MINILKHIKHITLWLRSFTSRRWIIVKFLSALKNVTLSVSFYLFIVCKWSVVFCWRLAVGNGSQIGTSSNGYFAWTVASFARTSDTDTGTDNYLYKESVLELNTLIFHLFHAAVLLLLQYHNLRCCLHNFLFSDKLNLRICNSVCKSFFTIVLSILYAQFWNLRFFMKVQ